MTFTADGIPLPPPLIVTNRDLRLGDDMERDVGTFLRDLRAEAVGTACAGLEPYHTPSVRIPAYEKDSGPAFGFHVPGRGPLAIGVLGALTLDLARAVVHACAIVLETTPGWNERRPALLG